MKKIKEYVITTLVIMFTISYLVGVLNLCLHNFLGHYIPYSSFFNGVFGLSFLILVSMTIFHHFRKRYYVLKNIPTDFVVYYKNISTICMTSNKSIILFIKVSSRGICVKKVFEPTNKVLKTINIDDTYIGTDSKELDNKIKKMFKEICYEK